MLVTTQLLGWTLRLEKSRLPGMFHQIDRNAWSAPFPEGDVTLKLMSREYGLVTADRKKEMSGS